MTHISAAGSSGPHVSAAGSSGLHVSAAGSSGLHVSTAGRSGLLFFIFTVFILLCGLLGWNQYAQSVFRRMNEEQFAVLASLYGGVKEQYPDFDEGKWIALLNGEEGAERCGEELLAKYGIFREEPPAAKLLKDQRRLQRSASLCLILLGCLLCGCFLLILCRRRQRIGRLVRYVRRVEQGEYFLDLPDNAGDELSGLKNELYKVTVILKENAKQAVRQRRALADSVSDISHQLKTPLTSCLVLLDDLTEDERMEEGTRRRFLAEITRQLDHMNQLIAALLKLSRLDAGVVEFERQEISCRQLAAEVMEDLEMRAEWSGVRLEATGEDAHIIGDRKWLGEALTNIVKNAIEHSPEGQTVTVRTEENKVYSAIAVTNYGECIPFEEQKAIFDRFYQGSYRKEDSTGIGLSLAKEIVGRQNGFLSVTSEDGRTEFLLKFLKN